MSQDYRTYHEGSTHHVFCKAIGGNIIFYSVQDCIFYITLYYHLAWKYGIITRAFSIMPNHIHSNEQAPSRKAFVDFHRDLNREFTMTYNAEHKRSGTLFMKPFGFAPKTVGKKIRENIAYIVNNAVAGNLADDLDEYRWNLMAYRNTSYPFSSKIALNKASNRLRRSVKMLKYYYSCGLPLTYDRQRELFKNLSSEEAGQLTDLIISIHNCLIYSDIPVFLISKYGSSFIWAAARILQANRENAFYYETIYHTYCGGPCYCRFLYYSKIHIQFTSVAG